MNKKTKEKHNEKALNNKDKTCEYNNNCECGDDCNCNEECHCNDECHCHDEKDATIELLSNRVKTLEDTVLRGQAELLNYRKRKDEETANALKYANQDIIKDLLNTVDNFERALSNQEVSEEVQKYLNGFLMIYENLKSTLKSYGVEEINRVGEVFDPNLEQALLTECVEDKEDEVVLEVLLKGYKLKDRVIRPASVKINQK